MRQAVDVIAKEDPMIRQVRVLRGANLEASTAPQDRGERAAPRRLSMEEKPVYDGIGKYFTVYGSGQINVRSAPRAVLEAIWGPDYANNTMALRAEGVAVPAMQGAKVTSDYFTIVSTGYNMDGTIKRTVKTVLQKSEDILDTVYWNDNYIE